MQAGKADAQNKKRISNIVKWLLTACIVEETVPSLQMLHVTWLYPGFTASLYVAYTDVSTPPPRNGCFHIT